MIIDTAHLFRTLTEITAFTPELILELSAKLGEERYKAHQILHAAGHFEDKLYFMETGFARNYYYNHDGNEHTVKFWQQGDILFSYEGYYSMPSYFYTEIMEESRFITLSYTDLHELDEKYPKMNLIIKSILLSYQQEEYERQRLIALPAEERYLLFRKNRAAIFKKAPARIIASYLHMTRETLTRYIGRN